MVIRVSDKKKNYSKVTKLLVKPTKNVNKILSDDISEICAVGDYLFYKKSNSSIDTVYRLNMITGEKIREA